MQKGKQMKQFIEYTIKQLVDNPDKVFVEENDVDENTIEFKVEVDGEDVGKIIGKKGKNINAIRTLLTALGAKGHKRATLQVVE
jgi:predicted RNA-binding protein YlqC (UPF0109 family)